MIEIFWLLLIVPVFIQIISALNLTKCDGNLYESEPVYLYGNHCYMLDTDRMFWDDAEKACQSRRGHLVVIPDGATEQFLIRSAMAINWDKQNFWIGATDSKKDGQWRWINGDKVIYSNWSPGSPHGRHTRKKRFLFDSSDTVPDFSTSTSLCAYFSMSEGGIWKDAPCHRLDYKLAFICQFDLWQKTTTTTTTTTTTAKPTTPITTKAPTTTIAMTTHISTTEEIDYTPTTSDESYIIDSSNITVISNSSQPVPDSEINNNKHTDPDREKAEGTTSKTGLVVGLTSVAVVIVIIVVGGIIVFHRVRANEKVVLDDVVAFDNSEYITPTEEMTINPDYFSQEQDPIHIYQLPDDTENQTTEKHNSSSQP